MMFFLYGQGGNNGKSTFIEIIGEMLGNYCWRKFPIAELLERRNSGLTPNIAKLPGTRMVSTSEIGEGKRVNEELIKDLTGGIDTIQARDLYQSTFTFKPQFKLWMFGNYKPIIRGTDNAIWERIGLIPFLVTIPPEKRDRQLEQKFLQGLPAIFNWGLQGVRSWLDNGLGLPGCMQVAIQSYRDEMNPLKEFADECLEFGEGLKVRVSEMYDTYKGFKMNRYETRTTLLKRRFNEAMEAMGVRRKEMGDAKIVHWLGVRIKPAVSDNDTSHLMTTVH